MIKIVDVSKDGVCISASNCESFVYLTREEVKETIRLLINALFTLHALSKEKVDKSECH